MSCQCVMCAVDDDREKLRPDYVLREGETFRRDVLPVRCRAAYEKHIEAIRAAAREHGYAIGVHGSLQRDIDLIAAPWTDGASDAKTLALAIEQAVDGWIHNGDSVTGEMKAYDFVNKPPNEKPHGRLAWSIHVGGGTYIDLSVMPRLGVTT